MKIENWLKKLIFLSDIYDLKSKLERRYPYKYSLLGITTDKRHFYFWYSSNITCDIILYSINSNTRTEIIQNENIYKVILLDNEFYVPEFKHLSIQNC